MTPIVNAFMLSGTEKLSYKVCTFKLYDKSVEMKRHKLNEVKLKLK